MLDFVSHYGFYQGDWGRTIFYGEPDDETWQAGRDGVRAWEEIREQLRPGLKFSDIPHIGNDTLKKLGSRFRSRSLRIPSACSIVISRS